MAEASVQFIRELDRRSLHGMPAYQTSKPEVPTVARRATRGPRSVAPCLTAGSERSGRAVGGETGLRERVGLGRCERRSVVPCDSLSGWSTGYICPLRDGSSASSTPPRRTWSVPDGDLRIGGGGADIGPPAAGRDTHHSPLTAELGEGQKHASSSCRPQRSKNVFGGESTNTACEETKSWLHLVQCSMTLSESYKNKARRSSLFPWARSPLASSGSAGETVCSRSTGALLACTLPVGVERALDDKIRRSGRRPSSTTWPARWLTSLPTHRRAAGLPPVARRRMKCCARTRRSVTLPSVSGSRLLRSGPPERGDGLPTPRSHGHVARRRTSQIAQEPRSTESTSSHPPSIHWNGQNQLPG
jgi:hypothetical protein